MFWLTLDFWEWAGPIALGLFVVYGLTRKTKKQTELHPELDRETDLLLALNDVDSMICFCREKQDYLSDASYYKLLNRIQESKADGVIYEELLKSRIDSLP